MTLHTTNPAQISRPGFRRALRSVLSRIARRQTATTVRDMPDSDVSPGEFGRTAPAQTHDALRLRASCFHALR